MIVQFNYSHEIFIEQFASLDVDVHMQGGNVEKSERQDWLDVHGHVPDNVHFGRHPNPDIEIQGPNPDIRITNNRGVNPLSDGWTVYTTEGKLVEDPPPNNRWALIRKGIDLNSFKGWSGDVDGPVVTTANEIEDRPRGVRQDVHHMLLDSDIEYKAYGRHNKDPYVKHHELPDKLREAGVYVNLSKTISPNALYEAMAVGCPIVTIPGFGAIDAVTHLWNGLIAETPEMVREGIAWLRQNPSHAATLGYNARLTSEGRYSREEFAQKWNALLAEVVGETSKSYP